MSDFQTRPVITQQARAAISSMLSTGTPTIQISHFAVGTGGYSSANPAVALAPSDSATGLVNEIFRSNNVLRENISPTQKIYVGQLSPNEGIGALGEVGIFATYLTGDLAGQIFLFAVANFPMKSKTQDDTLKFRMPVIL
jgi:hypothetical protein